jgi:hypothetical protein
MVRPKMLKIIMSKEKSKLQWLQDPREINRDNLEIEKLEASKYFRNRKREHLKEKKKSLQRIVRRTISETGIDK